MNRTLDKVLKSFLILNMMLNYITVPVKAEETGLCEHHPVHTEECHYQKAVEGHECTHECDETCAETCVHIMHDETCGYIEAVEGHECHYECTECTTALEQQEQLDAQNLLETLCTCETDNEKHATNCPQYTAPETPTCECAEKCTEANIWCDICGLDYTQCSGTDSAVVYDTNWYVVDAEAGTLTIDSTLGGKTYATENDITALVDTIRGYVDSGMSTIVIHGTEHAIYASYFGDIPAYAEALYLLADNSEEESQYYGRVDLILSDATEIVDHEFYEAYALKSITLPKVTTVGDGAFYDCHHLQTITFGAIVTSIYQSEWNVFHGVGVDVGGCDLILECGQLKAEDTYKPDVENKTWFKLIDGQHRTWKSITLTHDYDWTSNGDGTHDATCADCDAVVDNQAHSGGTATCIKQAICDFCKTSYGEMSEHNFDADHVCTVCGLISGYCDASNKYVKWTLADGTLTISGTGAMKNFKSSDVPWKSHRDDIKKVIIEDGVTSIGDCSFIDCNNLEEVNISASVSTIGIRVFGNHSIPSLTAIHVDDANAVYKSIDGVLFTKDGTTLMKYPENKMEAEFTIPDTVETIDSNAFYYVKHLEKVNISEGLKTIGSDAFWGCAKLSEITLPESLESIGDFAFFECISLKKISIPGKITTIEPYTFAKCSSLKEVVIPASVTSIEDNAFSTCNALESFDVAEENTVYKSVDGVLFSKDGKTLIHYPAMKEGNSYTTPDSVEKIEGSAFYSTKNLIEVTIADNVTEMGDNAFAGSKNLKTVTGGAGLTEIPRGAFSFCESIESITIPSAIQSIGLRAFAECTSLKEITIPENVTSISEHAFVLCTALTEVTFLTNKVSVEKGAFKDCTSLTSVNVPCGMMAAANAFDAAVTLNYAEHQWENGFCNKCETYCDHSSNTNDVVDNGNGTHSFKCSECQSDVIEDHDFTESESCKCNLKAQAKIGTTNYATLKEAAQHAKEGDTIVLLTDVIIEDEITFASYAYLDAGDYTITCNGTVKIGTEAGIIIENLLYYDGGDLTEVDKYGGLINEFNRYTYYKSGNGYMLVIPASDTETAVLELHNATSRSDIGEVDELGVISASVPLTIRFYGKNSLTNLYSLEGQVLFSTSSVTMIGMDEGAELFMQGASNEDRDGLYGIEVEGDLLIQSGTVTIQSGGGSNSSIAVNVGGIITVASDAVLNAATGKSIYYSDIGLIADEIQADGTINGLGAVRKSNTVSAVQVYGSTTLTHNLIVPSIDGLIYTFTVPSGTTLNVNEGVTLDLSACSKDDIAFEGTVINQGTIILPDDFSILDAPKGGTVYTGEKLYTWDDENKKWICGENSHVFDEVTHVCAACGAVETFTVSWVLSNTPMQSISTYGQTFTQTFTVPENTHLRITGVQLADAPYTSINYTYENGVLTIEAEDLPAANLDIDCDHYVEIKFDANGGVIKPEDGFPEPGDTGFAEDGSYWIQEYSIGEDVRLNHYASITRPGYTFVDWRDASGKVYPERRINDAIVVGASEDITIYAQWQCNHTGGTQTCKGYKCTTCNEYYGEPGDHIIVDNKCENCDFTYYNIYVGNVQVSSDNAADVLADGTVSYDADTHTLTLSDAVINAADLNESIPALRIVEGDIKLVLVGDNHLTGSEGLAAIVIENSASLTVAESSTGSLTAEGQQLGYLEQEKIFVNSSIAGEGSLSIAGGTVTAGICLSGDLTITDGTVEADFLVAENIMITGGSVTASGESKVNYEDEYAPKGTYGIYANQNIQISGGTVTTSGGYANISTSYNSSSISKASATAAMFAGNEIEITGGTVKATGGEWNGYDVNDVGFMVKPGGYTEDSIGEPKNVIDKYGKALKASSFTISDQAEFICGSMTTHDLQSCLGDQKNTIVSECAFCNEVIETASVTITAEDIIYHGSVYDKAAVIYGDDWDGDKNHIIAYTGTTCGGMTYNSAIAPSEAGVYTAAITINDAKAEAAFEIEQKEITPSFKFFAPNPRPYNGTTELPIMLASGGENLVVGDDVKLIIDDYRAYFEDANVGENKIVTITGIGLGGADAFNYMVKDTFTTTWSIKPASITVKPKTEQAKVFGSTDPEFDYEIIEGQLYGNDKLTGKLGRIDGEGVGEYDFTIGTLSNPNYTITLDTESKFTITKAAPDLSNVTASIADNSTELIDVQIEGAKGVDGNALTGEFAVTSTKSLVWGNNEVQFTFVPDDTQNYMSGNGTAIVTVSDTIAPVGKVYFDERNIWEELLNTISFNLFFKAEVTVKAEAEDVLSGIDTVEYSFADQALTESEIKAITDWVVMPSGGVAVTAEDAKQFVYFVRITDKAGNVTYLSTDGAVYDFAAPVITGITDGATYYTTQSFSATDAHLFRYFINGATASRQILDGNVDQEYVVVATDKAGNSATVTVYMKPISSLTETIKDLTKEDVTANDSEALAEVEAVLDEIDTAYATEEEKQLLKDAQDNIDELQKVVEDTAAEVKALEDTLAGYDQNTVKSTDEEAVDQLIAELTSKLEDTNLSEEQKATLEDALEGAKELAQQIDDNKAALEEAKDSMPEIDAEEVTADDAEELAEAKEKLEDIVNSDNYTEEEKEAAQQKLDQIEELEKVIEETKEAVETAVSQEGYKEKTEADITSAEKEAIEANVESIDKLLETDNLTEEQRKVLEETKAEAETLLKEIEENSEAFDEALKSAEDTTAENYLITDKEDLEKAVEDLKEIVDENNENYTEAEKQTAQEELNRVNSIIEDISETNKVNEGVNRTVEMVESIQDKSTLSDNEAVIDEIIDVVESYEELDNRQKELLGSMIEEDVKLLIESITSYQIIEGHNGKYTVGTSSDLKFTANGLFRLFNAVKVDGEILDSEHYTAVSGSTIITLKSSYLKTLSVGTHTLTVVYELLDEEYTANCEFVIANALVIPETPNTSDDSNLFGWMGLMVASLAAMIIVLNKKKKSS
ncbi:MAG: leucine-rich repeat protein [Erysipelotrichaceae bacterium]|nr:leucine-rich repeat protein [Erysipelotrichaceae bacterium]